MRVLVAGGTGGLGRLVVSELVERGHQVRVLSRQPRPTPFPEQGVAVAPGDLTSGEGIAAAVAGVHAVVDTTNAGRDAKQVMVSGTRRLMEAAGRAGVGHVVGVGIVGAQALARLVPYYRVKLDQEQILATSQVPWSWLRATQFHDFLADTIAGLGRLPVLPAPAIRYQPVDRSEVAGALADAVEAGPAGRLPDFAGPEALLLADFARIWSAAQGRSRPTLTLPLPGSLGRRLREGALCNLDRAVGRIRFQEWATGQVGAESHA
jgi:uncharacterized protein YbjT (DUF2867 family)